jgi:hypothetical protein
MLQCSRSDFGCGRAGFVADKSEVVCHAEPSPIDQFQNRQHCDPLRQPFRRRSRRHTNDLWSFPVDCFACPEPCRGPGAAPIRRIGCGLRARSGTRHLDRSADSGSNRRPAPRVDRHVPAGGRPALGGSSESGGIRCPGEALRPDGTAAQRQTCVGALAARLDSRRRSAQGHDSGELKQAIGLPIQIPTGLRSSPLVRRSALQCLRARVGERHASTPLHLR